MHFDPITKQAARGMRARPRVVEDGAGGTRRVGFGRRRRSAMNGPRTHQIGTMRVGVVLFDEGYSRVFSVHRLTIEDAREFAVASSGSGVRPRRPGVHQFGPERASQTAKLVVELDRVRAFDHVFVAGPSWARAMVCQELPARLRDVLAGALRIPVTAGENEILAVALPAVERICLNGPRPATNVIRSYTARPMLAIAGLLVR
jgi:hypothetical protein